MKTKTRINLPEKMSDMATEYGLVYDGRMKSWCVPENLSVSVFSRFVPLTIELVPVTSWQKNVRSELRSEWDNLRRKSYKKAGHTCEVCGATNEKLESHETWSYDPENGIQKLTGLVCLCHKCHRVKHWGLALINNEEAMVKKHILKVNNWKGRDLDKYLREVFDIFDIRSRIVWFLDLSYLETY